jgi:hypothetical protein
MKKIIASLIVLFSPLATLPVQAAETAKAIPQLTEGWRGSITPYLWLTNVSGSAYYDQTKLGSVDYSAAALLSNLNFAGMIIGEAHYGRLGLMADVVFSKVTANKSYIRGAADLESKTTVEQGIYTVAASYTLHNTNNVYIDGLAGMRVMNVNFQTDLKAANGVVGSSKAKTTTSTAPIVGVKGRVLISDSDFFIPFYLDVGAMGSATDLTTQQIIGVGRAYDWGDATIAFKNVYYKQSALGITTNQNLYGLAVGVTFKF